MTVYVVHSVDASEISGVFETATAAHDYIDRCVPDRAMYLFVEEFVVEE